MLDAGIKAEKQYQREIAGILEQVQRFDADEQGYVLNQLGITPIWYDKHEEIPAIVDEILA